MSSDVVDAPERESLEALEADLAAMMARLRDIMADGLTEEGLVEVTAIYNNVAYIFLYLEANEEHVQYDRLLPWRDAFHRDEDLDRRMLALLTELVCADPEAEESRLAYIRQLQDKATQPDSEHERRIEELLAQAKGTLTDLRSAQSALLARLGLPDVASPTAAFYRLISDTPNPGTREKLARAWNMARDAVHDPLTEKIDRMVTVRREAAAVAGYPTPLAHTLTKCKVGEDEVERFIDGYLPKAVAGYERLGERVRATLEVDGHVADHFGHFMRTIAAGARTPLFRLDECLDFIFQVARSVFGLRLVRLPSGSEHVIRVRADSAAGEVGLINFDLWDTNTKTTGANHTKGLRNRTDWSGLVQTPVAYVSCRFQRGDSDINQITFQNVHSLFHEFGHAINHLLIRRRISNRSGLEYLPLERLEFLSMWFEKWVYHPEFESAVTLPGVGADAVRLCRRLKALEYQRTYVERAITAALDFEVHRAAEGGLAAAFATLDDRYGVARYCDLADFPVYFTWPMYQANPGANFAYLWGAADSVEKFLPYENLTLDEIEKRPGPDDAFASCLDFALPTHTPGTGAAVDFYDRVADNGGAR
ncbi:M3 family metallopeptidase [Actinokineospora xionganensis]|uniref:Peptidase M3A/M3B catalytic domain-containing protein n=1 Tax=Actinokineospora xionganensis TaxID=2684470 RepID=A0ABR7L042_9PSEU|nr:M3 family metallopeptidase [Actinokineospora xionganensis]MBC6446010.1 hypothetical protein [Actinokineospora xionganensis]